MKKRLDKILLEKYPERSRSELQSLIMQGKVVVNGEVITKSGTQISDQDLIEVQFPQFSYVSRAAEKLIYALDYFSLNVKDLVVLDAGISTGGFTECLLERGAKLVYGIDVGYGVVHERIRNNPRVILKERTNLRYLTLQDLGTSKPVDMVTLDLSFISVLKVMPAIKNLLKPQGELIILIKPQFEAERKDIGKGGIIKDARVHKYVIKNVIAGVESFGFRCEGFVESPITGAEGNKEFLSYFKAVKNVV